MSCLWTVACGSIRRIWRNCGKGLRRTPQPVCDLNEPTARADTPGVSTRLPVPVHVTDGARNGRPFRATLPSILVGLALLVVALIAFLVLGSSVQRTERSLIDARARDAGLAVEALSAQSTAAFERAKLAARATRGDPVRMARLLEGITLPPLLSNIYLVRVGGDRPTVLYRVRPDAPTVLNSLEPGELTRLNAAATAPKDTLITWRRQASLTAAYAASIGVSDLVVFEEVTPEAALKAAFGSEELLDGAVYITQIEASLTLLATNAATLPIKEPRIKRPVTFADGSVGTLIVAARRPLVGTFTWRAKWLVLGVGATLALLLSLGIEALRRRRDGAVVLVGELQKSNTYLDELGAQLAQQAYHDSLTGLANRAQLLRELDTAVADPDATPPALLVLDLDNFKEVNDLMGHHTGDALLQEVATRLQRCVGDTGLVARLGGDEFAVLILHAPDVADLVQIAERIVNELRRPLRGHAREIIPGASIGICRREGGENSEELVRNADIAMYRAKARTTTPRWEVFLSPACWTRCGTGSPW